MKTKHPTNTMKFGVVTSDSDDTPLFTFSHGIWLNTEDYIKGPEKVV